jgi:hypothetical protein
MELERTSTGDRSVVLLEWEAHCHVWLPPSAKQMQACCTHALRRALVFLNPAIKRQSFYH